MATPVQRLQAVGDALLNKVATTAQLTRIGDVIGPMHYGPGYAALTTAQKASVVLDYLRLHVTQLIKEADAAAAKAAADTNANTAVEAEFAPAP